jgi:hypothetical protein
MKMMPIADPSAEITSGYLLVDTSNYPRSLDCEPLPICTCVPADLTNIVSLLPGVVDISVLDATQLKVVREILKMQKAGAHAWTICAVLTTDVGIEELSEHLGRLLSATDDDNRPVLWRFFDPRVFSLSIAIFDAEQRRALLGPIREWRFVWRRHWWMTAGHPGKWDRLFDTDIALPNKRQWQPLGLARLIDQVLLQVERESPLTPADCLRIQQSASVYLAEASAELNLSEPEELVDFAYMCVKYGYNFRFHPKLKQAKPDLVSGRLSWFSFRRSLDSADLHALEKSHPR